MLLYGAPHAVSALIQRGYAAIPIMPGSKRSASCAGGKWVGKLDWREEYTKRLPSKWEIQICRTPLPASASSAAQPPRDSSGIDIDTDDKDVIAAIMSALPPSTVSSAGPLKWPSESPPFGLLGASHATVRFAIAAEDFEQAAKQVRIASDILAKEAASDMAPDMTPVQVIKKIVATLTKHSGEATKRVQYRAMPGNPTMRELEDIRLDGSTRYDHEAPAAP